MSARQSSQTRIPAVQETSLLSGHSGLLQRCGCAKKPSGSADECPECKKKRESGPMLQRISARTSAHHPVSTEAPPIVHEVLRSPGQPLNQSSRAFMEPRFGYDFSRVRVHTDSRAAKSAEAVNAQAYTVGLKYRLWRKSTVKSTAACPRTGACRPARRPAARRFVASCAGHR